MNAATMSVESGTGGARVAGVRFRSRRTAHSDDMVSSMRSTDMAVLA
jgi:hypothetical protein